MLIEAFIGLGWLSMIVMKLETRLESKATYLLQNHSVLMLRPVIQKELYDTMVSLTRTSNSMRASLTRNILAICIRPTLEKYPNHTHVSSFGR